MTSFMTSSGSIEVARGNLPQEHLFKLEEAKLLSELGMPASSLAPEQLSRGSDLLRGIIRKSKLLTPYGDQYCVDGAESWRVWRVGSAEAHFLILPLL